MKDSGILTQSKGISRISGEIPPLYEAFRHFFLFFFDYFLFL